MAYICSYAQLMYMYILMVSVSDICSIKHAAYLLTELSVTMTALPCYLRHCTPYKHWVLMHPRRHCRFWCCIDCEPELMHMLCEVLIYIADNKFIVCGKDELIGYCF